MNILVQLWDPKADLSAFVEQQKAAWDASGIEIVSEADVTLASGQPAKEFVTVASDGSSGYFLFSVVGEDYLTASGSGDELQNPFFHAIVGAQSSRMNSMDYDVFLSHNSQDKPLVEQVAKRLAQEYGLKCWLDKWNLVPGEPWQEALEAALDQCRTVAVFVGPDAISPWENEEMRSALETRVHDKARRVIPVLLPGAPDSRQLKLPRFLSRLTWVDLRGGLEDENAVYRLYCGIQGIQPGAGRKDKKNSPAGWRLPPRFTSALLRLQRRRAVRLTLLAALAALVLIGLFFLDLPLFCGRNFASAPGYINLALSQRNNGRYACADINLHKALEADPTPIEQSNIYYMLASTYASKKQPAKALEYANLGLDMDAAYQDLLHAVKGLAYCQLEQDAEALDEFNAFLGSSPNPTSLLAGKISAILKDLENGADMSDVCWVISTDSLP